MGGARKTPIDGAFDLLIALLLDLRGDHRIVFVARPLCRTASGPTNIVPRLEPLVVGRNDFPGDADGVGHAGDRRGQSCRSWARIASVRCTEAESGNWTLTSR